MLYKLKGSQSWHIQDILALSSLMFKNHLFKVFYNRLLENNTSSIGWLEIKELRNINQSKPLKIVDVCNFKNSVVDFPGGPVVKNIPANSGDTVLIPGLGRFQRRQWHPTPVLLPGKSHGRRSLVGCSPWGCEELDTTEWLHFHFDTLEKEMATHSSVLTWRIPGTGEPGGLPSMGSHRVGHDWSNLAAAVWSQASWIWISAS